MHYFITGHTGFKGAWLVLMLREQGHEVSGFALDPEPGSLFEIGKLSKLMQSDVRADIRNSVAVDESLSAASPDVVIHLAAQPLVRESYVDPRYTIETNVNGTLNVLEAVRKVDSVRANLIVTTDKVYRNVNRVEGYRENEPLGGDDPYSASKAMADLLTQSWMNSFEGPPTAIARAGNVIGGGDVCKDRLLPDLVRAFSAGTAATIRYPDSVRPWQHVLDCLNGYLRLVDFLLETRSNGGAWNFGPDPTHYATVEQVCNQVSKLWGDGSQILVDLGEHLHEASLLTLNSEKARRELGWADKLNLESTLDWTIRWAKDRELGLDGAEISIEQIRAFNSMPFLG